MKRSIFLYISMIIALLLMGVYILFEDKDFSCQENNTPFSSVENICSCSEDASLMFFDTESIHFDFYVTDQNFFFNQTAKSFRIKKSLDNVLRFKIQAEKDSEKIFYNTSYENYENALAVRHDLGVYLYLKKLLI